MEGSRGYREESHEARQSPERIHDEVMDCLRKIEKVNEDFKDEQQGKIENRAEVVRERIRKEGLNMETLRDLLTALEETGFEAFSAEEINWIAGLLDIITLEIDPAYRRFYQDLKQRLTGIVQVKMRHEQMMEEVELKKREERGKKE